MQQQQPGGGQVDHDDSLITHPALALALRLIIAAKTSPSAVLLNEIASQLQSSPVSPPASLLSLALHPALPLLAKDCPDALQYVRTLVKLCHDPIPITFWPTAIGALSAASRKLKNENSRLNCVLLMKDLFRASVGKQFSDSSFSRPLAHIIGALLESARLESLKTLRVVALEAIQCLTSHVDAEALVPITPGLLSAVASVAAGDFKSGSSVLCTAISCFVSVMQKVSSVANDDSFRCNASMLSSGILRRRLYEGPEPTARVRSALVLAGKILITLPLTDAARMAWVDGLLALAEDDIVGSEAVSVLEAMPGLTACDMMRYLRQISNRNPRLLDVRAATRALRLLPSSEISNLWISEKEKIAKILANLLAIDSRAVMALQPRTMTRCSPYYQICLVNFPLSTEVPLKFAETLVQCLSYNMHVDLFTICLTEPNPSWLLIVDCIIRSVSDLPIEVSDRLIEESLFALDADTLPVLLRCIGSLALRLREDFRPLLLHCLFQVVLLIAHSSPIISQASLATLDRIAYALGYDSVTLLLSDNIDYLVDAISFRLASPDALNASRLLERLFSLEESSPVLAPLLIDTITTIIDCLDEPKLNHELMLSFFRVLNCAVRALCPPPTQIPSSTKTDDLYYKPENIANRLSASVCRLKNIRAKQMEWEKSFESERRDFVPPHLQKEAEEANTNEFGDEEYENKVDPIEQDAKQEPSTAMKTVVLIIDRCRHFIETPDLHNCHSVLELISSCLRALASNSDLLLPQVAKIWDPLKSVFSPNSSRLAIQKSLGVAEIVVSVCPEFVAHRVSTDLWPSMKRVLVAEQRILANALNPKMFDRASVAAQCHALRLLQSALKYPSSCRSIIREIATVTSAYLSDTMPPMLQENARSLFNIIGDIDPDVAWWTLVSLLPPPTASTPTGCIPLPLQWSAPNSKLFRRNAVPLLEKFRTLPEVQFDDYLHRDD